MTADRTPRAQRAVDEIMAAAREHLVADGPDDFSLREVARRAAYSPAALYNHFPNKEALINAVALEASEHLTERLECVPRSPSAPQRLLALGDAYLGFAADEPERYRLIFDSLVARLPDWETFTRVASPFTLIVEACADGLRGKELVDPDGVGASGLAYGLWATCHGAVMLHAHHLAALPGDFAPLRAAAARAHVAGITAPATRTSKTRSTSPSSTRSKTKE